MNKYMISIFVSMVLLCVKVDGQTIIKPGIGVNLSDVIVTSGDAKGKPGWLGGISFAFGKKLFFEPGIQFVTKSMNIDSVSAAGNALNRFDPAINGFRIPFTVGLNIIGKGKSVFSWRIYGGGSAFFITSLNPDIENKYKINTSNWGVFAGTGFSVWKFFVDASYEWSLTDISSGSNSGTSFNIGATRSIFVNAGLVFKSVKKRTKKA